MPRHRLLLSHPSMVCLFLLVACGGCSTWGDVSPALRVDQGEHPAYQDEQVRFKTTYYFRIVDACKVEEGRSQSGTSSDYVTTFGPFNVRRTGKLKIVSDSLYRFRMTGKASALFANIRFESGVLRAEQIDPFGSQVTFDQTTNTFRVVPASVSREEARRNEIIREIKRLADLRKDLMKEFKAEGGVVKGGTDEITNQITNQIANQIANQIKLLGDENDSGAGAAGNGNGGAKEISSDPLCPDGRPIQRSYFLYGPEGVRRLDPNQRLLMAMTSDSKPLIGMLQQLSGMALHGQQPPEAEWKNVLDERVRVSDALDDLKSVMAKQDRQQKDIQQLIHTLENRFRPKP